MPASSVLGLPVVEKTQGDLCRVSWSKLQRQGGSGDLMSLPITVETESSGSCPRLPQDRGRQGRHPQALHTVCLRRATCPFHVSRNFLFSSSPLPLRNGLDRSHAGVSSAWGDLAGPGTFCLVVPSTQEAPGGMQRWARRFSLYSRLPCCPTPGWPAPVPEGAPLGWPRKTPLQEGRPLGTGRLSSCPGPHADLVPPGPRVARTASA